MKVGFFAHMREKVGKRELELEYSGSIIRLLNQLVSEYNLDMLENDVLKKNYAVVLNGTKVDDFDYILKDGDEMLILPPAGGG